MNKDQYKIYHETKTHTPDDFPYNTYLCSIPLDFKSVNLHWHNEVEIIVIKKGCGCTDPFECFGQQFGTGKLTDFRTLSCRIG